MSPSLVPQESISVNSSPDKKEDLRPTTPESWKSQPDGTTEPNIVLTLPTDSTITKVELIDPINVAVYTVTITDSSNAPVDTVSL